MADNEVRKIIELNKLEDEEKELFGFDLSEFTTSQEIRHAENPWINQNALLLLINNYLQERLGAGAYVLGDGDSKTLRLSADARAKIKADLRTMPTSRNAVRRTWENYLNGKKPTIPITFDAETAEKNRDYMFITALHPLTKQAALHFASADTAHIKVQTYSDTLPEGTFPFSVYAWKYTGTNPFSRLITICEDSIVAQELPDILQSNPASISGELDTLPDWEGLELLHANEWQVAKEKHLSDSANIAMFKLESLENTHRNRVRSLEQQINDAFDESIRRMKISELETVQADFGKKIDDIKTAQSRADIHTALLANGVIVIEKV